MKLRGAAAILIFYSTLMIQRAMPELPERIPTSFNFRGRPTSTGGPETLWLLLAVQALIVGLLLAVPYLARYAPQWVSLGNKRLSDFAPNARGQILPLIERACGWAAAGFALFFSILIRQLIGAAMGSSTGPSAWLIPVFLLGLAGILAYFGWHYLQINKALAASSTSRGPASAGPQPPRGSSSRR